jgi:NAD(P)-dependent dehydrogenase (short-subunit alcohol dehydrogenase family)
MVAATLDEFGAIDVLVNAAGRMSPIGVPLWE